MKKNIKRWFWLFDELSQEEKNRNKKFEKLNDTIEESEISSYIEIFKLFTSNIINTWDVSVNKLDYNEVQKEIENLIKSGVGIKTIFDFIDFKYWIRHYN